MKLTKDGKIDRRQFNKPTNVPKNHPWRKTWVESPQGYQRSLQHGYKPMLYLSDDEHQR